MVGSISVACRNRSAACRMATYSRSTALMRDCHSWLSGILPHLRQNLLQCLLRERQGLGLAHRGRGLRAGEHIMEIPTVAVVVEAGNVIVSWHEVQIDDALGARGRSSHRFEQNPASVFLHEQCRNVVLANPWIIESLFDATGGPTHFLGPLLHLACQRGNAIDPERSIFHPGGNFCLYFIPIATRIVWGSTPVEI